MTHCDIEKCLSQIPKEDQHQIEYFFRHAIFWDGFGYVLLGSKPCAIGTFQKFVWNQPSSWLATFTPHNQKMIKGWKTWQKYKKYFPHPNFVFLEEDSVSAFISLIHRQKLQEIIQRYQSDFDTILEKPITGDVLLTEGKKKPFFAKVLKNHDGLIGTILGYGRNNAWLYYQKSVRLHFFPGSSEQERMKKFCEKQGFFGFFLGSFANNFNDMPLPSFKADPEDLETKKIHDQFLRDREKLIDYFDNGNFLALTLKLLCS